MVAEHKTISWRTRRDKTARAKLTNSWDEICVSRLLPFLYGLIGVSLYIPLQLILINAAVSQVLPSHQLLGRGNSVQMQKVPLLWKQLTCDSLHIIVKYALQPWITVLPTQRITSNESNEFKSRKEIGLTLRVTMARVCLLFEAKLNISGSVESNTLAHA